MDEVLGRFRDWNATSKQFATLLLSGWGLGEGGVMDAIGTVNAAFPCFVFRISWDVKWWSTKTERRG